MADESRPTDTFSQRTDRLAARNVGDSYAATAASTLDDVRERMLLDESSDDPLIGVRALTAHLRGTTTEVRSDDDAHLDMFDREEVTPAAPAFSPRRDSRYADRHLDSPAFEPPGEHRPYRTVAKRAVPRTVRTAAADRARVASRMSVLKRRLRHLRDRVRLGAHDKLRRVRRWALPVLVAIVVVESAWLVLGAFRGAHEAAIVPAVAATEAQSSRAAEPSLAPIVAPVADDTETRGTTGAAVSPKAVSTPTLGAVTFSVPFQVEIYENGRFVGINEGKGVALSPGKHQLELVNESLGYRASVSVSAASGRSTEVAPDLPAGTFHLNATPWAEVFVDGESVGETPLANVQIAIGPHTILFKHPELGEQARRVLVTAGSTQRIGVDLRK